MLQLLRPEHANKRTGGMGREEVGGLIRLLGGSSGRDVDKKAACKDLGYAWEKLPEGSDDEDEDDADWPDILPSCVYYLKLELVGDTIDCGSHDVALCRVVSMISSEEISDASKELDALSTRQLRNDSIISELGRVIPLEIIDEDANDLGLRRSEEEEEFDNLDQVWGELDVY